MLEAGADGARGGERGRGRVARVAVRDVVDGNSAEVELADGGANPRLRGARGGGGGARGRPGGGRSKSSASDEANITIHRKTRGACQTRERTRGLSSPETRMGLSPGDRSGLPGEVGIS